ncbi:MAG: TolC family protein [Acidobacteriaceae bacterium]|nr:TolC family protein [Acidobacteriaceae bacterium]
MNKNIAVVDQHDADVNENHVYTLGELIDIAESNNPTTRAAWNRAKSSAASVGIAKSELYPTVIATAAGTTFLNPPLLYRSFAVQDIGAFETAVHLDYTLIDFGARRSEITATQARLIAANLNFNNTHLVLIQQVCLAYYSLLNATGLRRAAEVSLKDAKTVEAAAQDRRDNGLATVPEVLEARAATAKANYDLQIAIGAERVAFGNLATAITATPVRPFNVEPLEDLHIPEALDVSVEKAIARAFELRPDLQADEARVRASEQEVKHAYTAYYPTLEFNGGKGWVRAWGQQGPFAATYAETPTYMATLSLRWTLFDGFRRESAIAQAKAEEAAAKDEVRDQQDQISNQVWSEYTNAETALAQRQAAISLLAAASESYSAAIESYKDGVRNFLDVLSAENDLARARAVDVTAGTQVLQSFTDLAFRTGELLGNHPKGNTP